MTGTPEVITAALDDAAAHDAEQRERDNTSSAIRMQAWYDANASMVEVLLVLTAQAHHEWDPDLACSLLGAAHQANGNVDDLDTSPARRRDIAFFRRIGAIARRVVHSIDHEETYADMLTRSTREAFFSLAQRAAHSVQFFETELR